MPCYTNFFWATFFIWYDPLEFSTGACPTPSGLEIGKTHHCALYWYFQKLDHFNYCQPNNFGQKCKPSATGQNWVTTSQIPDIGPTMVWSGGMPGGLSAVSLVNTKHGWGIKTRFSRTKSWKMAHYGKLTTTEPTCRIGPLAFNIGLLFKCEVI